MTRAGLLLAVVSYYGLHWLAGVELPTATRAADAGPVVIWQFARMAGTFLQYLIPLLCVVGAVVSLLSGRRRKALGDQVGSGARAVGDLDWREFERLAVSLTRNPRCSNHAPTIAHVGVP